MVSLKLRYKAKHPKMIIAVAKLNNLENNFRQEVAAVVQTPSELEFWSQYKIRMDELQKLMAAGAQPELEADGVAADKAGADARSEQAKAAESCLDGTGAGCLVRQNRGAEFADSTQEKPL